MKDILYLSADSIFDVSDARFAGPFQRGIHLLPNGGTVDTITNDLPGIALGDYFLIAQTDALNNIFESNETNNVTISEKKVTVTLPELPFDTLFPETLHNNMELYYRIEIPDTLEGETMLVSLSSNTPSSMNEFYISYGAVPSRAVHDLAYSEPFVADQTIVVPELQKGQYYLMAYGTTTHIDSTGQFVREQTIDLKAEIIPFEIREINSNKGGNTGNVTIELKGAKFSPDMEVSLEDVALGDTHRPVGQFYQYNKGVCHFQSQRGQHWFI